MLTALAATSIAWSNHFDLVTGSFVRNFTENKLHAVWNFESPFSAELDLAAIIIIILIFIISLRGLKLTTLFNNVLAVINIGLLLLIIIAGLTYGSYENLTATPYTNGFSGIVRGASIVMYAYIGFESSTFAIDETINPTRNIPLSMIISLIIISVLCCGSSFVLNLMQPFDKLDIHAAYPKAFQSIESLFFLTTIGPLISLTGALVSSIYTICRIAFSMSKDGLLFKFMSNINPTSKIPDMATIVSLIMAVFLIIGFNTKDLIGFTDISTFLIFSTVALGLLVVRYDEIHKPGEKIDPVEAVTSDEMSSTIELTNTEPDRSGCFQKFTQTIRNKFRFFDNKKNAIIIIFYIYFSSLFFYLLLDFVDDYIARLAILGSFVLNNIIFTILLSIFKQTLTEGEMTFRVKMFIGIPSCEYYL